MGLCQFVYKSVKWARRSVCTCYLKITRCAKRSGNVNKSVPKNAFICFFYIETELILTVYYDLECSKWPTGIRMYFEDWELKIIQNSKYVSFKWNNKQTSYQIGSASPSEITRRFLMKWLIEIRILYNVHWYINHHQITILSIIFINRLGNGHNSV